MAVLGIDEKVLLDPNFIKIIDSIAGAGKSSLIHKFFMDRGIEYIRTTSTNVLKFDAQRKYEVECKTVCSALFMNEGGHFYDKFREPEIKTIVIDEVLQTNKKVFDWCLAHVGEYNIIITTDSHQMLSFQEGDD